MEEGKRKKSNVSLCIMLPTWNEAKNIKNVIKSIREVCDYEIIVTDRKSEDDTAEIARKLGVEVYQRKKKDYGYGLIDCLNIAKKKGHTHLLTMDCDMTYPTEFIPIFYEYAKLGYDLVNASRKIKDIRTLHILPNMIHTSLVNLLFLANLKDINSGMKMMKIDKFIGKIKAKKSDTTAHEIIIALKNKYKLGEFTISYDDRHGDESRGRATIRFIDGFIILYRIIIERFTK